MKHFKWNSLWFLRWCPLPIFGRVTYNAQFPSMKGRLGFSLGLMAYGRYDYLAEKTAAFEAWSQHVSSLVNGGVADNVVALRG